MAKSICTTSWLFWRTRQRSISRPLLLRRGQVGTVVMTYDGSAFEVEFSGRDGRAYALLPLKAEKLMVLREAPESAVA